MTDPYVTVEIFGIPADCAEERTKTVPHNGKCSIIRSVIFFSSDKLSGFHTTIKGLLQHHILNSEG